MSDLGELSTKWPTSGGPNEAEALLARCLRLLRLLALCAWSPRALGKGAQGKGASSPGVPPTDVFACQVQRLCQQGGSQSRRAPSTAQPLTMALLPPLSARAALLAGCIAVSIAGQAPSSPSQQQLLELAMDTLRHAQAAAATTAAQAVLSRQAGSSASSAKRGDTQRASGGSSTGGSSGRASAAHWLLGRAAPLTHLNKAIVAAASPQGATVRQLAEPLQRLAKQLQVDVLQVGVPCIT